jgi:hypothetical protein
LGARSPEAAASEYERVSLCARAKQSVSFGNCRSILFSFEAITAKNIRPAPTKITTTPTIELN